MDFTFVRAPPDLSPWVIGFAQRRDQRPLGRAIELPLAYPLIQFLFGTRYRIHRSDRPEGADAAPSAGIWGATTLAWQAQHTDKLRAFVLILTHSGLYRFTGILPAELRDQRVPIADVIADSTMLEERLADAASFQTRVLTVCRWLRALPQGASGNDAQWLTQVDRAIVRTDLIRTSALARDLQISARTLHAGFTTSCGMTPKKLLRIARLGRVLRHLHPSPWQRGDNADPVSEYFEESHFFRDFKQLTTISPSQYRNAKRALGDPLINTLYLNETAG